jgi:hypothetical protein
MTGSQPGASQAQWAPMLRPRCRSPQPLIRRRVRALVHCPQPLHLRRNLILLPARQHCPHPQQLSQRGPEQKAAHHRRPQLQPQPRDNVLILPVPKLRRPQLPWLLPCLRLQR